MYVLANGINYVFRINVRFYFVFQADKLNHLNSETGPCRFIVYDSNSGGAILSGEMYALFEDMEDTKRRFLDSITGILRCR